MNWLAHLLLSKPDVESRLGNILADVVKGTAIERLSPPIQKGIQYHQSIDIFTDSHPIFKCSKQRISSNYRKFSGILIDVFYDHFLAKNWLFYLDYSLDEFTTEIYSSFQSYPGYLPAEVKQIITRIEKEDWLGSYRYINGVENGLQRISKKLSIRRTKRFFQQSDKNSNLAENTFGNNFQNIDSKNTDIFALEAAVCELMDNYDDLENDFHRFFEDLLKTFPPHRH